MSLSLNKLDEAIISFRVATQRPGYTRRLVEGLEFAGGAGFVGGVASLRMMRVVERLGDHEGGPSIRRAADELGVEHSTASRSVDALVKAGLLTRTACSSDLRQSRLELTEDGRAALDAATARRQDVLGAATYGWSDEDIETLTAMLRRLRDGFDRELGKT